MTLSATLKAGAATMLAVTIATAVLLLATSTHSEELKSYDSSKKDFWLHPPDDWFMGDETKEQKGTHVLNTLPPPTGFTDDEIKATLQNDQAAARLQDRAVGQQCSAGAANGLGQGRYPLCRFVPGDERLRNQRRGR